MSENKSTAIQKGNNTAIARILPKFNDLISDTDSVELRDEANDFMVLLNQNPHESWIKRNQYANNSAYLTIGRVEFLLKKIFVEYKIEVIEAKQIFNSIHLTVRVHYLHPIKNEWMYHDGVGAKEVQVKASADKSQFDAGSFSKDAVAMATGIAKSTAIKDACHHFGKIFGSDLNRKDNIDYDNLLSEPKSNEQVQQDKQKKRIAAKITVCQTKDELEKLRALAFEHELEVEFANKMMELQ